METQSFLKSKTFKFLISFTVILGIIVLIKFGYHLGQWLFHAIN
jgi:hypothetical protein